MKTFTVNENDAGQRLDKYLSKCTEGMPKSLLYKYIRKKRVKVNGSRAHEGDILRAGDTVELWIPDEFFEGEREGHDSAALSRVKVKPDIVYEDENILLCDKKPGVLVHLGDEGDKVYYDFHVRDDYDRSKGLVMGMKTIYVQLKEGTNIIYYGCEGAVAPGLDKLTVTPTKQTQDIIDGINEPGIAHSTIEQVLRLEQADIVCSTLNGGILSLYNTSGHLIQRVTIAAGETKVKLSTRGIVIATLDTGTRSFARKFIIR